MGQVPQSFANAASERIRSGVVAEDDEQFGGGVGADAEAVAQAGRGLCGEPVEFAVMARDFGVEGNPAPRERSQGVLGGRGGRVDAAGPVGGASV